MKFRIWIPEKVSRSQSQTSLQDSLASDEDENSAAFTPVELLSDGLALPELVGNWRPKYQIPLRSLSIKQTYNSSISFNIDQNGLKQKRDIVFGSVQNAEEFVKAFNREKARESRRLDVKMKGSLGGIKLKKGEMIDLLVEVVSGWNLPIADVSSSDPFVICSINGKEVHRTKYIPKTYVGCVLKLTENWSMSII